MVAPPRSLALRPSVPTSASSETRPVGTAVELDEPDDPALDWLDRELAQELECDALHDVLAVADDDTARPIPEDEVTPPPKR